MQRPEPVTKAGTAVDDRIYGHLTDMCDGGEHIFFDHELAGTMLRNGWIWCRPGSGNYSITDAGRELVTQMARPKPSGGQAA